MRICDQRRNALGRSRTPNHAHPLLHPTLALRSCCKTFETLIQHPLDRALRHAQITRAEPLVEPLKALFPQDLLDHPNRPAEGRARARHFGFVRVELEAGFDDPYGVGRGTGGNARESGSRKVNPGVLCAVVEAGGDNLLAVAVGEKVDGAGGYDADKGGPETLEECAGGFVEVDVTAGVV